MNFLERRRIANKKYYKTFNGFLVGKYNNIRWLTHSENSSLGSLSRFNKVQ